MHPLDGVRVVDFTTMLNGPYTTTLLSDMGAEVVKVEPPDGDPWRNVGGGFAAVNRGKRAICLDLKKEKARQIACQLIERSDVVVENARWGVWHRLGLDYDSLLGNKPDLIYVSVLGHGSSGPRSSTPGYDPLLQSRSGESIAQGGYGKPPVFHQIAINDMATPILGAYGAVLALLARARTGKGQHVESSLTNASIALQSGDFVDYAGMEREYKGDTGIKGLNATHRFYEAGDRRWVFVMCRREEHWRSLCEVLQLEGLLSDPRFESDEEREKNDKALVEALSRAFQDKSSGEWLDALSKANVPSALGQSSQEVIHDPHCDANSLFVEMRDPQFGPMRILGAGPKLSRTPGIVRRPAPMLGQHTEEVLTELGYTEEQITELKDRRIVIQAHVPE
ncbi:CaiB/BaiF CoA transferase family protein [Thermodesulfobacteriota bacterium]